MDEGRQPDLSARTRAFLHVCVDSVHQMELLVQLRNLNSEMTVRDLAGGMDGRDAYLRQDLETLAARGLLAVTIGRDIRYRYAPSDNLRDQAESLIAVYRRCPDVVIRIISGEQSFTC